MPFYTTKGNPYDVKNPRLKFFKCANIKVDINLAMKTLYTGNNSV